MFYLFRVFVLAFCIILAGLSAAPAEAGILARVFGRNHAVSVSKSKTKVVQPTAKKVRQPCRIVNGRLVCPR
ncbi:MAG: hypothetical protein E6Q97_33190 [Desulfurellales bacterium]|nr:MAG: hypothetical protein E6Q97_33190 [Desulfurellales bacterium]